MNPPFGNKDKHCDPKTHKSKIILHDDTCFLSRVEFLGGKSFADTVLQKGEVPHDEHTPCNHSQGNRPTKQEITCRNQNKQNQQVQGLEILIQFIPFHNQDLAIFLVFHPSINDLQVPERRRNPEAQKNEKQPWRCAELPIEPVPEDRPDSHRQSHGKTYST